MQLAITVFELSSGQTYKQNELDNRPDIRLDDRIKFKLYPVLQNNIIHTSRKFHANRLNIKEVYYAGSPVGYPDCHQNQ